MAGEGGGPNPPYKESFLENIVAVGWGGTGGVFVSGDFCCYQRYTKLEDNKSFDFGWFGLGSLAFGDAGGTKTPAPMARLQTGRCFCWVGIVAER